MLNSPKDSFILPPSMLGAPLVLHFKNMLFFFLSSKSHLSLCGTDLLVARTEHFSELSGLVNLVTLLSTFRRSTWGEGLRTGLAVGLSS